jgi:hypothetical protein
MFNIEFMCLKTSDNMTNDSSELKKKYAISKHHAWAGSILLAILLAIRIFFETSNINEYNQIILIAGFFIIIYMIISLLFTYKYRSGLSIDEKSINLNISSDNVEKSKINEKLNKNLAKIEKKKTKEKLKELKKSK